MYGDETMEVCGDDVGFTEKQTCNIINPMGLVSYKGALYASSSNSTSSEILKIQGKRLVA